MLEIIKFVNVIDNEIIGGIDDGQVLFKNRENLSK